MLWILPFGRGLLVRGELAVVSWFIRLQVIMERFYHIPTMRAFDGCLCQGLFPLDGLSVRSHRARSCGISVRLTKRSGDRAEKYRENCPISSKNNPKNQI